MDRVIINTKSLNKQTITKDSYVIINDEVQSNDFEFNIINCKAIIIDKGFNRRKKFNVINSDAKIVEIVDRVHGERLSITNDNSNVEYSIIDLSDEDVDYNIDEKCCSDGSVNILNIASVCYKNKNKNYVINTSNIGKTTMNEINCFGIVKDKSVLNYNVTSTIKKGAKKSVVRQNSNILLFDENSLGTNKPILVIEENDVKASHGSSIGKIDDDTMFYLCSRGLTRSEATNLICLGKVEYLIKKIEEEDIKSSLVTSFKERME